MFLFKQIVSGEIRSVEAKSVDVASPDFVKCGKKTYQAFMKSLPAALAPGPTVDERLLRIEAKLGLDD